jgi:hypothetical protein
MTASLLNNFIGSSSALSYLVILDHPSFLDGLSQDSEEHPITRIETPLPITPIMRTESSRGAATLIRTKLHRRVHRGMEPKQGEEKGKKERPSRAELERLALKLSEQLQGRLKGHVDGDAEEYLSRTMKKRSGSHANR